MDAAPSPRHAGTLAGLLAVALLGAAALLFVTPGSEHYAVVRSATAAVACIVAGLVIATSASTWPGARAVGLAFLLVGGAAAAFAIAGSVTDSALRPHVADVAMLVLVVPFAMAGREEFVAHVASRDRREVLADVLLLTLSLSAIGYVALRPAGATVAAGLSAATFAILTASIVAIFGTLALWVPTRAHLLVSLCFVLLAVATARFGAAWAAATSDRAPTWSGLAVVVIPPVLACIYLRMPHVDLGLRTEGSTRLVRPVLTSVAVLTACAALSYVAVLDDARGIAGVHSTALLLLLGLAIAARVLTNQFSSREASVQAQDALERRESALAATDAALDRVQEANESLRRSEEHLRLVFDAAVDGFVELDDRRQVLRANDAFARMVSLDALALVGMSWTALGAAIDGADPAFARLVTGGPATINRSDGQTLHLESTASVIPTDPPRTLVLVRDVSAAKVADQTIRSLFQFLQDRDEDRTRLFRRSNAAIEQERNRIARDLHDGPVQGVSAASLSLEAALLMIKAGDVERGTDVLVKIREELAGEADALRRLMAGLRPPVLEERGLIPALRETLSRFGIETGVVTSFEGELKRTVPRDVETLAYRLVQEALSNVGKHAEAATVTVLVTADGSQLRVEIEDDGRGFETNRARDFLRSGRVGLASMRERVELASGTFTLRSTPGRGTVVTALIPVDEALVAVPAL
jgi:PAS domain S-box-containing protein